MDVLYKETSDCRWLSYVYLLTYIWLGAFWYDASAYSTARWINTFHSEVRQPKWYISRQKRSRYTMLNHICRFDQTEFDAGSDANAKDPSQRSKVKVTKVKIRFNRFRNVTPVWIHICKLNEAQSLIWYGRGVLLFFKVIC